MRHCPDTPFIENLYDENSLWLQGWLRRRLGCAADAADLAHDVFVRLLRRPPARAFDNHHEARSYLCQMAGGMCINLWQRREIEQAWLDVLAAQPEESLPSAEDQAIILQSLHEIGKMLLTLPPKAATAFVLAEACGMTDKEVAQELGVSARMVRKYLARAMLGCMELKADFYA